MMCLYFDVVPPERKDRVNQWLLANYEQGIFSPYAYMFLFEVLYRMDTAAADQLVLDLMRQHWAEMARGETQTVWEDFLPNEYCHVYGQHADVFPQPACAGGGRGWSGGNRRIVIEPRLGDLRRVEGTVVTEFGPVPVLWEKADDGKKLTFQVRDSRQRNGQAAPAPAVNPDRGRRRSDNQPGCEHGRFRRWSWGRENTPVLCKRRPPDFLP